MTSMKSRWLGALAALFVAASAHAETLQGLVGNVGYFSADLDFASSTATLTMDGPYADLSFTLDESNLGDAEAGSFIAWDHNSKSRELYFDIYYQRCTTADCSAMVSERIAGQGRTGALYVTLPDGTSFTLDVAVVPEPSSLALMTAGAALLGFARRRRL